MSTQHRHTLDDWRPPFDLPPGRQWATERPRSRVYQGQEAGSCVTRWLNGHQERFHGKNSAASRQRIMDLLSNLRDVLAIMREVRSNFDWMNEPWPKNFDSLTRELAARLDDYPTTPHFLPNYGNDWEIEDGVAGRRPPGESVAAHSIIKLAQQGLLDRIGLCGCGKWYFARFLHQRSCSASCRRKLYEKTEEFREKRRKYMRKYYRLKNSGKVK